MGQANSSKKELSSASDNFPFDNKQQALRHVHDTEQEFIEVFKSPERASYEFCQLLRSLPEYLHGENLSEQQLLEVEAADLHALNCTGTLLRGLQSLGRVMRAAGQDKEVVVDGDDLGGIGGLITEVALHLQFLCEFSRSVAENDLRMAYANNGQQGAA